jgi:hypothetical protein
MEIVNKDTDYQSYQFIHTKNIPRTHKLLMYTFATISLIPFNFLAYSIDYTEDYFYPSIPISILIAISSCLAMLLIHELMHALFFYIFGKNTRIGFVPNAGIGPAFYATSTTLFTKGQFLLILLAPQILTIIFLLLYFPLQSFPFILNNIIYMTAVNFAGGVADFYMTIALIKVKNVKYVEDMELGIKIYREKR